LKNISPKYLSKISLLIISALLILIVVVSCAPQQQLTDDELEAELAKLTPEEREELVKDLENKESGALAGQASAKKIAGSAYAQKISPKAARVVTRASSAQTIQIKTLAQKLATVCKPKTKADLCFLDQTCGDIPDGCGGVVQCGNLCGDLKKPYCVENKCRPSVFCEDSDNGINLYEKGVAQGRPYSNHPLSVNVDTCRVGLTAGNKYDQQSTLKVAVSDCKDISVGDELTYEDAPGQIINPPSTVMEVDGCFVTESYCIFTDPVHPFPSGNNFPCPNGCKDGACLPSPFQGIAKETVVQIK